MSDLVTTTGSADMWLRRTLLRLLPINSCWERLEVFQISRCQRGQMDAKEESGAEEDRPEERLELCAFDNEGMMQHTHKHTYIVRPKSSVV